MELSRSKDFLFLSWILALHLNLLSLDKGEVLLQNNPDVRIIFKGISYDIVPADILAIFEAHAFGEARILIEHMLILMESNVT